MVRKISQKRIPTLLAFAILFFSIWVTLFLVKKSVNIIGKASPTNKPANVFVSNITDSSFNVNFTTSERSDAVVTIDAEGETNIFYDLRDPGGKRQLRFYSHQIKVLGLSPKNSYTFSIISNGEIFSDKNSFTVTTGSLLDSSPIENESITGKIILPEGKAGADILVQLTSSGIQNISALTKDSGEFEIPLSGIRSKDLGSFSALNETSQLTLLILQRNMSSKIETLYKDAKKIPLIIISQNYDFVNNEERQEEATSSSDLKSQNKITAGQQVKILTPQKNESFTDSRPLFKGNAIPGEKVKLTINSDLIETEVTADKNGFWTFRPSSPLSAGQHTITIETLDSTGLTRRIIQNFLVFGSGSMITESATPSATPTIAPTITPSPSPTPTATPTSLPTPTPTMAPTAIPTLEPSITASSTPTTPPTRVTPVSPGSNTPTFILTFVSVMFVFAGATLLFLL